MLVYLLPGVSLLFNGKPFLGLFICLMQMTIIGWLVGIYMANSNLKERAANRRHREMMAAVTQPRQT